MARLAKKPILIPKGLDIKIEGQKVIIKGPNGQLGCTVHSGISVSQEGEVLRIAIRQEDAQTENSSNEVNALWGTAWAHLNNMIVGVTKGFEKKLLLVGVGYRAQVQGKKLNLSLGFSHPTVYDAPADITIEMPTQTEIIIKGADKQLVGQVAAEIRAIRSVEPYKGKGVRYSDERVVLKETKKK